LVLPYLSAMQTLSTYHLAISSSAILLLRVISQAYKDLLEMSPGFRSIAPPWTGAENIISWRPAILASKKHTMDPCHNHADHGDDDGLGDYFPTKRTATFQRNTSKTEGITINLQPHARLVLMIYH
jgi:hypothetical protein